MKVHYVLLSLLFTLHLYAQTTITLENDTTTLRDFPISHYIDHSKSNSFETVQKEAFISATNRLSLGSSAKEIWIKFTLLNATNASKTVRIHNSNAYFEKAMHFYTVDTHNNVTHTWVDLFENRGNMQLMHGTDSILDVSLEANESKTVYIHLQNPAYNFFELLILDPESSIKELVKKNIIVVLMIGILLALAVYNTILFFSLHLKEYLYYALYLVSSSVWLMFNDGVLSHYFDIYSAGYYCNIALMLNPILLVLFLKVLFKTSTLYKFENVLLNSVALLFALLIFFALFDFFAALNITALFIIYPIIVFAYVGISLFKKGNLAAKYFLVAHLFFILSASIAALFYEGYLPYNDFTLYSASIGIIFEAIALAYVLSYKMSLLQKENIEKEQRLLLQSRKAQLGEMISIISHQLKQPLSSISAQITYYTINKRLKTPLTESEIDTAMESMQEHIDFASTTIDEFRHFFNPKRKATLENITKTIMMPVHLLKNTLEASHIEIVLDLRCDKEITTYHNDIVQVLMNIMNNAKDQFKNSRDKKQLVIKSYAVEKSCVIEVIDNAGGIPVDILPKIFDRYFSTKTSSEGTGLGLDICKVIVEDKCKGSLKASNTLDGAQFTLTLVDLE